MDKMTTFSGITKDGKKVSWRHAGGKFRRLGPDSCTESELIAIVLGSGVKNKSALQIAEEILERHHSLYGLMGKSGELRQYVNLKDLRQVTNIQNPQVVDDIDLLWIKDNKIACSFEIEATTAMTESLNRGSNIDSIVPKFLIIPQERESQLINKMRSPMFAKRYTDDNWAVIFFEALREEYWKKGEKDIFKLVDKKVSKKALSLSQESQTELFS